MKPRPTAIVDIDGTLANLDHRLHHLNQEPGARDVKTAAESKAIDWEAFHTDCYLDSPIIPIIQIVQDLADANWCIILVTGRGSKNRWATEDWLDQYEVPYDLLLMRKENDHSPDVEVKQKWLDLLVSGELSVPGSQRPTIAIEDRTRTIQMWRKNGIIGLQCDEGDF